MNRSYLSFFLRAFGWFTLLMLPIVAAYVIIDPFHCQRYHQEPAKVDIETSRGFTAINCFDHFNDSIHYDSFIIGSSVAGFYDIEHWQTYLPTGSQPIHINNSCQTTHQLLLNCQYIAAKAPMRHVLIVLTPQFYSFRVSNGLHFTTPIKIQPSIIGKADSWFRQFRFAIDRRSIVSYICVKWLHTETPKEKTLGWLDPPFDFVPQRNIFHCEQKEEEIRRESREYLAAHPYAPDMLRSFPLAIEPGILRPDQVADLQAVKAILEQEHADYRVVMTPSQYPLPSPEMTAQLVEIFGQHYIDLSAEFGFYFLFPGYACDHIHPMPELSRMLIDRIYGDPSPNAAVPQ
ncbi:MAG: hypothetical protein ACI4AM_09040 [Muribaculaceae bacterium]